MNTRLVSSRGRQRGSRRVEDGDLSHICQDPVSGGVNLLSPSGFSILSANAPAHFSMTFSRCSRAGSPPLPHPLAVVSSPLSVEPRSSYPVGGSRYCTPHSDQPPKGSLARVPHQSEEPVRGPTAN